MSSTADKAKNPSKDFGKMVEAFGEALGEIFNDPELKSKAKEFGKSASDSAETLARRFKDEDVRRKFKDA